MLYLMMNHYGYYLGTDEDEVKGAHMKLHSRSVLHVISCNSAPDAIVLMTEYTSSMNAVVIPEKPVVGKPVQWEKRLKQIVFIKPNLSVKFYFDDRVVVSFPDGTSGEYLNAYSSMRSRNETIVRLLSEVGYVLFYSASEALFVKYYPCKKQNACDNSIFPGIAQQAKSGTIICRKKRKRLSVNNIDDSADIIYARPVGSSLTYELSHKPKLSASISNITST